MALGEYVLVVILLLVFFKPLQKLSEWIIFKAIRVWKGLDQTVDAVDDMTHTKPPKKK